MMSLCLFRLFWSDSQPKSDSSFSMLHILVAPVMILQLRLCAEHHSIDALSHTEYSNRGRTKYMYICFNDLRLTLKFTSGKVKSRPSLRGYYLNMIGPGVLNL